MKNKHYVYSTKDITKYYDLTAKGLAYYEEQNLISPLRAGTAGYRIYTLDDCYSLYHSKLYTNTGFRLKETAELLGSSDEDEILERVNQKVCEQEKELERHFYVLERIRKIKDILENYRGNGPVYTYEMSPDLYRLYVRNYEEEHLSTMQQSREFAQWNQVIPANTASLKYAKDAVLSEREDLDVNIGNVMPKEAFELFEFEVSERVEFIPGTMCIQTVIVGDSEEINNRRWLEPVLTYMEENGYRLNGDIVTSLLLVTGPKGNRTRYDYVWVPAEKIQ